MAEQKITIRSGFFNAVEGDRTYFADDMNKPYKKIVCNGVFATPAGTPSEDFQVYSVNGLVLGVKPGNALVKYHWMETNTITSITIPANAGLTTREDGVFLQIDDETRTGNIVYRTGVTTPEDGELMIAKVTVPAGVTSITQSAITDMRGTSVCRWVTGLIDQVDTSVLFEQYNSAFREQFEAYQQQIAQNIAEAQNEWSEALAELSDELTVSTNIVTFKSFYVVSVDETSTIPIQIESYDSTRDQLFVYINGLCAPSDFYSISGENIVLTNTLNAGDTVLFVCFKAFLNGNIGSAVSMMQKLDNKLNGFMSDSGWIEIPLQNGTAFDDDNKPYLRCIGNRVYIRGAIKGIVNDDVIAVLPISYAPAENHVFVSCAVGGDTVNDEITITINPLGEIRISAISGAISATDKLSLTTAYLANMGNPDTLIYTFCGNVPTYDDLPEAANAGDVYMVLSADAEHYIAPGDSVMWNGAGWEILQSVINSGEIETIINALE